MKNVRFIATAGLTAAAPSAEEYFAALHRSSFEASTMSLSEYIDATRDAVSKWTGKNVRKYTPQELMDFMLEDGVSEIVEEDSSTCPSPESFRTQREAGIESAPWADNLDMPRAAGAIVGLVMVGIMAAVVMAFFAGLLRLLVGAA